MQAAQFDKLVAGLDTPLMRMARSLPPSEGLFRDFVRMIHANGDKELMREQLAASLLLTLRQTAGSCWSSYLPSLLLVRPEGTTDPLDGLLKISSGLRSSDPKHNEGCYTDTQARLSRQKMREIFLRAQKLQDIDPERKGPAWSHLRQIWPQAKTDNFSSRRAGQYARMWDPIMGLMTDADNSIILRIERDMDYELMRTHILHHPHQLAEPQGSSELLPVPKKKMVAVSGSITADRWDAPLIGGVLNAGLPVFFLPHLGDQQVRGVPFMWDATMMELASSAVATRGSMSGSFGILPYRNPMTGLFAAMENAVRARLRHLPAGYEFWVLTVLRELVPTAVRLANLVAMKAKPATDEIEMLISDLCVLGMRGIAAGIESLKYHGWGFDAGCDISLTWKLLAHLRTYEEVSRRALHRTLHMKTAVHLNNMLEKLSAEGLVELAGPRLVRATSYRDFVKTIDSHPALPRPQLLTTELVKAWDKTAA